MQQACPEKTLYIAQQLVRATCRTRTLLVPDAMNGLKAITDALEGNSQDHQIHVSEILREKALRPLNKC